MSEMTNNHRFQPYALPPAGEVRGVALLVHPGFQILSLSLGTVFEMANIAAGYSAYRVSLYSEAGGPVPSSVGFSIQTLRLPRKLQDLDTIIVSGNLEFRPASAAIINFLRRSARSVRRVTATCTGALFLAQAGLLSGRRATTHWFYAEQLRQQFPEVTVQEDRIYVEDGPIWTSAGMTAGIDLAIALVEEDLGEAVAKMIAKQMVVFHRRTGGQSQHSVLLDLAPKTDRIQHALAFAKANLKAIESVEDLARVSSLSSRQFARLFRQETGASPAHALERLRVEAARVLMERGAHSLEEVSNETGFNNRERMRRAFLRAYGQPPQALRRVARAQFAAPV